jgi:glycosyltransferase involved in cell wall biosynthesis
MKISVITATRNCVGTIADCLASVAGQSYPDQRAYRH